MSVDRLRGAGEGTWDGAFESIVDFFGTLLSTPILLDLSRTDLPWLAARPDADIEETRRLRLWLTLRTALATEAHRSWSSVEQLLPLLGQTRDPTLPAIGDVEALALEARMHLLDQDVVTSAQKASAVLEGIERQTQRPPEDVVAELELITLLFTGLPSISPLASPEVLHRGWLAGRGAVLFSQTGSLAVRLAGDASLEQRILAALDRFSAFLETARGGLAIPIQQLTYLAFRMGEMALLGSPAVARECYEYVIANTKASLASHFDAVTRSAECALTLGDLDAARGRFEYLDELGIRFGDRTARHLSLVGLASMLPSPAAVAADLSPAEARRLLCAEVQDDPAGDDPRTRYAVKRRQDRLVHVAAASAAAESDSELLAACVWAAASPGTALRCAGEEETLVAGVRDEVLTTLALEVGEPDDRPAVLREELRPLRVLQRLGGRLEPGTLVVIVAPMTGGYAWLAVTPDGPPATGHFAPGGEPERLLAAIDQQLDADLLDDALLVAELEEEIRAASRRLTEVLPRRLVALLEEASTVHYVGAASADSGAFPLEMVAVGDRLLCERTVVARAPNLEWLRHLVGTLGTPDRGLGGRFLVVAGSERLRGVDLAGLDEAVAGVAANLRALGLTGTTTSLDAEVSVDGEQDLEVVHFVGHGAAQEQYEGLPSRRGTILDAAALRRSGLRPRIAVLEACDVGRLRYVGGGLHDGLPAALVSGSASAAVGFSGSVLEARARRACGAIYEHLGATAVGEAVLRARRSLLAEMPLYMRASLLLYGDPAVALRGVPERGAGSGTSAGRWAEVVRHLVLRDHDTLPADDALPEGMGETLRALVYPPADGAGTPRPVGGSTGPLPEPSELRLLLVAARSLREIPDSELQRDFPFGPSVAGAEGGLVVADQGNYLAARCVEAAGYALGEPALEAVGGLIGGLWLLAVTTLTERQSRELRADELSAVGREILNQSEGSGRRGIARALEVLGGFEAESRFVADLLAASARALERLEAMVLPPHLHQHEDWTEAPRQILRVLRDSAFTDMEVPPPTGRYSL